MSEKFLCPRLADYLVIVGSRSPHHSAIQPPELLRRYPLDDHKDFPLPIDVVFFCQPEGCVSAGPKRPALRDAVSFVFTLTDKDSGKTRYGVCLNFYRRTERTSPPGTSRRKDSEGNPTIRRQSWRKSLEKSSDSAFSSDHRSGVAPSDSEREGPSRRDSDATTTSSTTTTTQFHPTNPFLTEPVTPSPRLGVPYESESGGSKSPSPAPPRTATRRKQRSKNHTLTSLCLLSHHPFFSSFRQCLTLLKKLIDACNDNTAPQRVGASKQTTRDSLWSVLTGRNTDLGSSIVAHDVREIETWILRLLSCPVPVPGSTRVELEVLPPELHPPLVFALPDKTRFSLTDFPLHLPLELLGVDSCLQVLTLIFLECKVVIQSRDYSALSMSVLALVTMLYPCEYMFPVIPLLPTCMSCAEQLLLAPTPFIIGIPASFLPYKKHFRLPEDIWLVDLDANKISGPKSVERDSCDFIPALPEPECSVLRNHLKQAMGRMDLQVSFSSPSTTQEFGVKDSALTSMASAPFPELTSHPSSDTDIDRSTQGHPQKATHTAASNITSTSSSSVMVPSPSKAKQQAAQKEPLPPLPLHQGGGGPQPPLKSPSKKSSPGGSSTTPTNVNVPPHPHTSGQQQHQQQPRPSNASTFNPLIYGNDVDSVDVATRIAMVRFFNSANILANFNEHTRTLRLYPRPVVAFQITSFLRSRSHNPSQFLCRFARTQAVEYLAEWSLAPTNLAFLRVQTGVYDPTIIGDKAKWFAHTLQPITFNIHVDVPGLCSVLSGAHQVSAVPTDESGSDSEGAADSGDSTSSYSSLSDFVSELASSDLSASRGIAIAARRKSHQKHQPTTAEEEYEVEEDYPSQPQRHEVFSRNITQLCSSLDLSTVYNPPSSLLLPGVQDPSQARKASISGSGSGTESESSVSSGDDTPNSKRRESRESRKSSAGTSSQPEGGAGGVEDDNVPRQQKGGSPAASTPVPSKEPIMRQGSFGSGSGSILGHIASHAKELVKETKRQSSQEGLLSQVDKLKTKTKEKLTEVKHGSLGSSGDESSFLSPLEHLTSQAKRKAGEAGKSVQASLSKTSLDEFTTAGKSTWDDITKSAKKGLLKSLGESTESKEPPELTRKQSLERRDSTSSTSSIASRMLVPQIKGDVGRNTSRDFFANMSTELNGLATQTTSMFSDFFGGGQPGGQPQRSSISACPSPNRAGSPAPSLAGSTSSLPTAVLSSSQRESTANQHHGPFPTGRKGLVERSSLIRHTTSHLHPKKPKTDFKMIQKLSGSQAATNSTSAENQAFMYEVANQVLNGEGVGWLRVGRLKKLFEDEGYRVVAVAKINKTLDRKIGPDDHIDDVCVSKPVWKGMIKLLQLLVGGLEFSYANRGIGGMASAFQILEIAHTHYWTKDIADIAAESGSHYSQYLDPNVLSPGVLSMQGSPISSEQASPEPSRRPSAQVAEPMDPNIEQHHGVGPGPNTTDVFRDIFQSKKQSLMSRLSSSECHIEGVQHPVATAGSGPQHSGSVVVNPVMNPSWSQIGAGSLSKPRLTSRLSQMSLRSTVSDTELEQGSGRGKRSPSVWSSKSALAAGLRYHAGSLIPTGSSPTSPENGRMYLFEGLVRERSSLWDQMQFWEDAFLDAVAQEREMVGMDQGPREMMERYKSLSDSEKKRLEHEEDRLLATQLYNLVSFMLMMDLNRVELKQKVRRLLGKSFLTAEST